MYNNWERPKIFLHVHTMKHGLQFSVMEKFSLWIVTRHKLVRGKCVYNRIPMLFKYYIHDRNGRMYNAWLGMW